MSLLNKYMNNDLEGETKMGNGKCPVTGATSKTRSGGTKNADWWPDQLNLNIFTTAFQ